MRIAVISDIHANLEALQEVLKEIDTHSVDTIHCLGDVVGYGSEPAACLELVNQHCEKKLMGNHDHAALGQRTTEDYSPIAKMAAEWTKQVLTDKDISIIDSFTMEEVLDEIHLVHASPNEPESFHYLLSQNDAKTAFPHVKKSLCFVGHTHIPTIFTNKNGDLPAQKVGHSFVPDTEGKYLINVGSVGQPRDNDPRASYVIYDSGTGDVHFNRVQYDFRITQEKMEQAKLPEMLIERLAVGQ